MVAVPPITILVPTDFSEPAQRAADYAAALAKVHGSKVLLLHVPPPLLDGAAFATVFTPAQATEYAQRHSEEVLGLLHEEVARLAGVDAEPLVELGLPVETVARVAEEQNVDLVILGSHGRKGLRHALIGSVAERVVHLCKRPTLVVR